MNDSDAPLAELEWHEVVARRVQVNEGRPCAYAADRGRAARWLADIWGEDGL
jgi:hypothetical protein